MAARFPDAQRRMRPRTATILAAVVGVWFGSAGEDPGPGIFIGALFLLFGVLALTRSTERSPDPLFARMRLWAIAAPCFIWFAVAVLVVGGVRALS